MELFVRETGFGYIVVGDERFDYDIVLCIDHVFKRPKHLSSEYRGLYGHTPLSLREVEDIVSRCRGFDAVVIGTGQYGCLPIMSDAREYLDRLGVDVVYEKTQDAIGIVNKMLGEGRRVLAILHVTC